MKKKRLEREVHPTNLWDSLTPAQRRKLNPRVVDARLFVLPFVKAEGPPATDGRVYPEGREQKRLEEAALLARWRRKHLATEGIRSAGRRGASGTGKSRS
jgi:hypothetical protein